MVDKQKKKRSVEVSDENVFSSFDDYEPSVTWAVFVYWILPVLLIGFLSRFLVDPHATSGLGIGQDPDEIKVPVRPAIQPTPKPPTTVPTTPNIAPTPQRPKRKPTPIPTLVAEKPSSYIEAVQGITRRRLNWEETDSSAMGAYAATAKPDKPKASRQEKPKESPEKPIRGASSDPVRNQLLSKIDELRGIHGVGSR